MSRGDTEEDEGDEKKRRKNGTTKNDEKRIRLDYLRKGRCGGKSER